MTRSRTLSVLLVAALAVGAVWFLARDRDPPPVGPLDATGDADAGQRPDPGMLEADARAAADGARAEGGRPPTIDRAARGPVTGTVVDDRDRPIPGASVQLALVDERGLRGAPFPDRDVLASAETDREGRFTLEAAVRGWMRVVASAPGRATVAALVASAGSDVLLRLPAAGSLAVDVLDEGGRPVAGASVEAYAGETRVDTRSEAKGRALLTSLPPGDVRLSVAAEGHGTVRAGPVRVRAGEQSTLAVVLTRGVQIAGAVIDAETGAAIEGARVYVSHPGRSDEARPTGADGRFGPLPGGGVGERVFLVVEAEGYRPALEPVVLHADDVQRVAVRMTRGEAWAGTVRAPPGQRLGTVVVGYTTDGTAGRTPAEVVAGEDGRFTLPPPPDPLPGRRVVLYARNSDGAQAALALRPGAVRPDPLVLQLVAGATVTGRVRNAEGQPLAGVQVRLTPAWDRAGPRTDPDAKTSLLLLANERGFADLAAASDTEGGWMIPNVAAGSYQVRFRWQGGQHWRSDPLDVEAAGTVSAGTETLGAGYRISGRVRDGRGRPAEGATIRVTAVETPRHVHRASADADGYYEVAGVPAGTYLVRAFLGVHEPVAGEVQVEGHRDGVDLDFDPGAVVAGRIESGGTPYSGPISLRLRRAEGGGARPPQTVTVRRGRFRWEEVPSGTWRIDGRIPGGAFAFADGPIEVEAGRITDVVLTTQAPAAIAGSVVGRDGGSAGARIQLRDAAGAARRLATADASGRFLVGGLEPGTWTLRVWGRGGAPIEESVSVDAGARREIELELAPAGSARVTVVDAKGNRVAGAVVLFRSSAGPLPASGPDRTGRDGRVHKDGLPVGPVLVLARGPQGQRGRAQATVIVDERAEITIALSP